MYEIISKINNINKLFTELLKIIFKYLKLKFFICILSTVI